MQNKEVEIVVPDALGKDTKYIVVMKRLNYGEKVDLEKEASNVRVLGNGQTDVSIDLAKLKILSILKSIVKSDLPNIQSYDVIRSLPQDAGEQLFETYTELNALSLKKND